MHPIPAPGCEIRFVQRGEGQPLPQPIGVSPLSLVFLPSFCFQLVNKGFLFFFSTKVFEAY